MKERFIRFMSSVDAQSTDALFKAIDNALKQKVERVHLLISSPGGSVSHGLSVYNYIKGIPLEVYTYNFGSVDSIGVVMFCAGSKRFSVPNARFLMHGVKILISGNTYHDEKQIEELLKSVKIDQQNIAKTIAETTQKSFKNIEKDMYNRTTLTSDEAQKYGLVNEIQSMLIPKDAEIVTIGDKAPGIIQGGLPLGFPFPGNPLPKQIQISRPIPAVNSL